MCSRRFATYPTSKLVLMTVAEAAIELNLETADIVYRLLRVGKLRGTKRGKTWDVDADSVAERKRSVELKRSSRSNAQAERARRVAEVEAMFYSHRRVTDLPARARPGVHGMRGRRFESGKRASAFPRPHSRHRG